MLFKKEIKKFYSDLEEAQKEKNLGLRSIKTWRAELDGQSNALHKLDKIVKIIVTTAGIASALPIAWGGYEIYNRYEYYHPRPAITQKTDYQKSIVTAHPEGLVFNVGNKCFLDKGKDKTLDEIVILKDSKIGEKDILKKGDIGFEGYETEFKEQVLPNVNY